MSHVSAPFCCVHHPSLKYRPILSIFLTPVEDTAVIVHFRTNGAELSMAAVSL